MKITFFVSGNVKSNFSYRVVALAKSLNNLGHNVSIVAPKADKYNNFVAENISMLDGVRILQPFQFTTSRLEINLLPYLFGAIRMLFQERPDMVYIYKPTPISIVGVLAKLFWKTPVVVDLDDLGSEVMKIEGHPIHQRKLVEWSERIAIHNANRLVVASPYLLDLYRGQFPQKPIYLMPNGVDSEWFESVPARQTEKRIVFLGSLNRQSILEPLFDVLPKLLERVPETKVLIIGDGKYLSYFKQKSESLHIDKHITFTGWLELSEARTQLKEGDIGYNYMPNETTVLAASNMKVSQYMSRGVVPIVSDIGDLSAVVDHGRAGYIAKAGDLASLEATLLHALNDDDRAKKAEQARAFSRERFSWDTLAAGFDAWIKPRKPDGKKKLYFVSTSVPDDVGGAEIRNYNLIRQIKKQTNIDIEVFCTSSKDPETERKKFESNVDAICHVIPLKDGGAFTTMAAVLMSRVTPTMADVRSSGLGDAFRKACERSMPDVVQIEQLEDYFSIRPHMSWLKQHGVTVILDCHNVEFQVFDDSLKLFSMPKRLIGKYLVNNLRRLEIEAAKRVDIIFTCSDDDASFFKRYNSQTHVIPNGVDVAAFRPTKADSVPTLIFMGGVKYPPNGDAVEFYLQSIHPQVKAKIPNLHVFLIGTDPKWLAEKNLSDPSVEALGFVPSVQPYLERSLVGICPVRYGSGTRIKIMTYMAAGLPVVSTTKGAEGVTYTTDHDIIITDDANLFASSLVTLLTDKVYRDRIGRNGHEFIRKNYDWDVIGKKLGPFYK